MTFRFSLLDFAKSFLFAIVIVALFAPWISPHSYDSQDLSHVLALPSMEHWMGTDRLGRDVLSRVIYGARISLFVGLVTTAVAMTLGTFYGAISAYAGGKCDHWMMRIVDVVFSLPDLLLIILITVITGRGVAGIFIALTLVSWVSVARLVRGEVLRLKELQFVEAARALGSPPSRILVREILPNLKGVLLVTFAFRVPIAILTESTLSFIGLGIAPPESSWGTLANEGWMAMKFYPHLIFFPALVLFLTILSFNLVGESFESRNTKYSEF